MVALWLLRNSLKSHNMSIKDSNAQNTLQMKYHKNKKLIPSLKSCKLIRLHQFYFKIETKLGKYLPMRVYTYDATNLQCGYNRRSL